MACFQTSGCVLLILALACIAQFTLAARHVPAMKEQKGTGTDANDKKQTDCLQEGTVVIPGLGRATTVGPYYMPSITGLDHSIPAATHSQYLPGGDDTFIPNPGFEIPNPFNPSAP